MVIEGVVGRSYRGDIAIDDVTMTDGICPGCKYTTLIEEINFNKDLNKFQILYHISVRDRNSYSPVFSMLCMCQTQDLLHTLYEHIKMKTKTVTFKTYLTCD